MDRPAAGRTATWTTARSVPPQSGSAPSTVRSGSTTWSVPRGSHTGAPRRSSPTAATGPSRPRTSASRTWHCAPGQAETVSSALDLESDMSGTTEAPAGPGEHRVQVAQEAERSLRLGGRRHGDLDELAASGRTEARKQSDERGQDHERHEHAEDRHGHRQDSSGKVGGVVAEVVPPGAGVGEEPGERAIGDARRGCGGDRMHGQGFPPVAGPGLWGARDRANASIEQGGLAPTSAKTSGFETEEVDSLGER